MNVFVPEKPEVVVLVDSNGYPCRVASNIISGVKVTVTDNPHDFRDLTENKPFVEAQE